MFPWFAIASALFGSGVALAAGLTHRLRPLLTPQRFETLQTALHWHQLTGLALLILALWHSHRPAWNLQRPMSLLTLGALLFCLSLELYAVSGFHPLVYITPIGGILMITSWIWLTYIGLHQKRV